MTARGAARAQSRPRHGRPGRPARRQRQRQEHAGQAARRPARAAGRRAARGAGLRVGYFAQHQTDELDADETPIQHMARALPRRAPPQVRSQLARFGLDADRAERGGALSGGEKARLLLALTTRDAPQLLILDEPTNHLDIDAREALVAGAGGLRGRGAADHARSASGRAGRRPTVAGRGRDRATVRGRHRRLSRCRRAGAARGASGGADRRDDRRDRPRRARDGAASPPSRRPRRRLASWPRKTRIEAALANPALWPGPRAEVSRCKPAPGRDRAGDGSGRAPLARGIGGLESAA